MTPLTSWAAGLGLRAPIVCAPMGGVAGGALASAVSRAGGLGMIGMGSSASHGVLARELAVLGAGSDAGRAPFGVGFVGWRVEQEPEMLELALEAGPALVSVSFLDWGSAAQTGWIERVKCSGALAVTQVATVDEAIRAEGAGVDAVVARGLEAGGHGDHREPRRSLLAGVLSAVDLPVLSAGAVHDARGVAEVLDAGAAAVWVGTAFSACTEALTSQRARAELFAANGEDTVVSRVLDAALGLPWPARFPERLLRTDFVDRWQGREDELSRDSEALAVFRAALEAEDYSVVPLDAGEGVGALTEERTAAEVVASLSA